MFEIFFPIPLFISLGLIVHFGSTRSSGHYPLPPLGTMIGILLGVKITSG
jgi:hypothetical protein